jgi:hypothetical protein
MLHMRHDTCYMLHSSRVDKSYTNFQGKPTLEIVFFFTGEGAENDEQRQRTRYEDNRRYERCLTDILKRQHYCQFT